MANQVLFLTELLGLKVFDLKGRRIGVVKDAALVPLVDPVRIDRFLIGGGMAWLTVRHDQVRSISLDGLHLRDEVLTPYHSDEYMLRVGRDLVDQQIIDAQGRKVVRVNDVTFEIRREDETDLLWVLEVDIGVRSIFRRLVQGILPPLWVRRLQDSIPPHSIRWEFCNILEPDPQRRLRLNISNRLLEEMHPSDLADIVENLNPENREAIFESIDSEMAAETLSEMDPEIQASIMESLETEKAAEIVEEMSPNEAADLLNELEDETSEEILDEMSLEDQADVNELRDFDDDTAGGLMNTEYVALLGTSSVSSAIEALKGNEEVLEDLNVIFLIDSDGKLTGAVPLVKLFIASGSTPLNALAGENLIWAHVDERQERLAEMFDKYNLITLPVVDADGKLTGAITADDIITLLRQR